MSINFYMHNVYVRVHGMYVLMSLFDSAEDITVYS